MAGSEVEREVLPAKDLEKRLDLVRACWAYFGGDSCRDIVELRRQPRGGGRDRESIMRHTYGTEPENLSRKVGVLRGRGRSSFSCAAPLTTSWIMRGRWKTGT